MMSISIAKHKSKRPRRVTPRGKTVGIPAYDLHDLISRVEAGLPFSAIEKLQKASGLPVSTLAELVHIPQRTLARRRATGKLSPEESERLLRIATVFEETLDLFEGDRSSARAWLSTPKKALAGETPLHFARTEIGAREVEALIGRLEHGVFS
jgi:putative toxin-antitoxin system antitoxin component (TIGR02293 family)